MGHIESVEPVKGRRKGRPKLLPFSEEQAKGMTVAELAEQLRALNVVN